MSRLIKKGHEQLGGGELKEVQQEVQQDDTTGKAGEMLVEETKRQEKLRRSKGSSGWDLGNGPEQLRVTTGVVTEQCVMEDCTVLAAEGVTVYSKGLSDLLQNMRFISSD